MKVSIVKRILCFCLLCCFLSSICSYRATADADMRRVVVGADLTQEQLISVYSMMGIRRGDVSELILTNAEEHELLDTYVESSLLGTRSISCVYLELLPKGSGLDVQTHNISWYTPDMYASTLETAGITDARLIIAAPFSVSGTGALAGAYKAYEDMTGQPLVDQAKEAGTQELTVTGDLADEIGSEDSASIIGDLKKILQETEELTDDELRAEVRRIAASYHVTLTDAQVEQLLDLCRTLQKLDDFELKEKVEDVQDTLQKVSEAKSQLERFLDRARSIFDALGGFFDRIRKFLDR